MQGRKRPALFLKLTWRDARYTQDDGTYVCRSWEISRELPDMPLISGGMTGFELAEMLTRTVIIKDLVEKVGAEGDEDGQGAGTCEDILCASPACGERARGAVVWYPFDVGNWSGHGLPEMVEQIPDLEYDPGDGTIHTEAEECALNEERFTMGVPVLAWCGNHPRCKAFMLAFMLKAYGPLVKKYSLTGGKAYCWQCGCMDSSQITVYTARGVWCRECDRGDRRLHSAYGVEHSQDDERVS